MYRHLLVPLDDSPLSVETVRKAVEFARTLGSKVTFMHAQEDFDASSVGALQRVVAPAAYNDALAGEARAILSKAEVVAREMGVPHDSVVMTSNRPYEAILGSAASHGCDLIFMASHGRRGIKGLLLGSQTQKVLQHAAIPVLVSAIESNVPAGELVTPLTVIGDEHRSMAAVVQGLELIVRDAEERRVVPSFPLLRAIVHYIRAFPEALHHPKEEAYLFRKLRERTSELDDTLAELERQHVESMQTVDRLERSIEGYAQDPSNGLAAFAAAARRFGEEQMAHMRLETKVILPAARKHLTPEDWVEIATAFGENGDPRFAADNDEEFRQLFARILNLAPASVNGGTPDRRPAPVR